MSARASCEPCATPPSQRQQQEESSLISYRSEARRFLFSSFTTIVEKIALEHLT